MKILDQNLQKLIKAGVYKKEDEHDACGVGFVASIDGKPRREVVENGIEALKAVWHRGAVDKDGKTGDGAGIHVELSKDFFFDVVESGVGDGTTEVVSSSESFSHKKIIFK